MIYPRRYVTAQLCRYVTKHVWHIIGVIIAHFLPGLPPVSATLCHRPWPLVLGFEGLVVCGPARGVGAGPVCVHVYVRRVRFDVYFDSLCMYVNSYLYI